MRPRSIRARLALWYTAVLGLMLVALAAVAYVVLVRALAARTDATLADVSNAVRTSLLGERAEVASDSLAIAGTLEEFRFRDLTVAVYDPAGRLVPSPHTAPAGSVVAPSERDVLAALHRRPAGWEITTVPDSEGGVRVQLTQVTLPGGRYTIALSQSLHGVRELGEDALTALLAAIPLALVIAGAGGWFLATRALAPVVLMSDRAARIGAGNARERLPIANPHDELGHLAAVFNALLERLGGALEQQRRFMADASHELRTPVSIVRAEADVSLARAERPEAEYRDALTVVRVEAGRLTRLVNDLFLLARADAGEYPIRRAEMYLEEVVLEEGRAVRSLAAARGVVVECAAPAEAPFRGDEELLRRMLRNLLDNAIKYGPPDSVVWLALEREAGGYGITVRDEGPGIAPEVRERIFERFFRADRARSRSDSDPAGGAGLGLAIARWVAEAHGGSLVLVPAATGTEFHVWLPWGREELDGAHVALHAADAPERAA